MKPLNFKNISQSFTTKNFKYGGYATLMFLFMLAILIGINLVAEQLPLKFDLSENRLFSLSAKTTAILKSIKQDITIYALYAPGKEEKVLMEALKKYPEASQKVTIKTLDPNKNPGFIKQYAENGEAPGEGALIVISGTHHKVIQYQDLFGYYTNQETMQPEVTSLALEQRVTGAIQYVATGAVNLMVYQIQGHGEDALPAQFVSQLQSENYKLNVLTLATQGIPADTSLLVIASPKQDITENEAEKIRQYLANRGRALILVDYVEQPLTNLNSVLASYGVAVERQVIIEGDSNRHIGNPLLLLPQYSAHSIVNALDTQQMPVLIPVTQSIKTLDLKKQSVAIEPLLTTSEQAWAKKDTASLEQEKSAGDPQGPFNLAVAITDNADTAKESRIVLFANGQFINPKYLAQVPGNITLFNSSISWLENQKNNLDIQPKNLMTYRLRLNAFQTLIYAAIVIVIIPLTILVAGLFVWLRRRHL